MASAIISLSDTDEDYEKTMLRLPEVQLLRYYEPAPGLFIAESAKVIARAIEAGYEPVCFTIEDRFLPDMEELYRDFDVPVYTAPIKFFEKITGYKMLRGVTAIMKRKPMPQLSDFLAGKKKIAVLEDVENPTNVGAIFRSAAALGLDGVVLTKDCADPLYRRSARVSMGTVFQIPWIKPRNAFPAELLKSSYGFAIAGMALCDNSVYIQDAGFDKFEKLAVFMGNEYFGLKEDTLAACDRVVKIPMHNGVDSLNVAVAAGVAFYEVMRAARADQ